MTNAMAQHEDDFAKGRANGADDALGIIDALVRAFETG